jgi:NAD(P)-dependent dehydrogenase (short-subunit alcohol dehydrogenase family)
MKGIKGKRIIIGGGATGMGAALAERAAAEGARVVVGDINQPALEALVDGIVKKGGDAIAVVFDLADAKSIDNLVATCVSKFGGVDGVAIPGADLSPATLGNDLDILHMDADIWRRTLEVNLLGHVQLMRAAIPHMIAAGGGGIVSVSSAAAHYGHKHVPAYAASKAGLHAVIRHVSRLCGKDKIRCNAVAPGLVATKTAKSGVAAERFKTALNEYTSHRLGEPEDLAAAMLFLLSDDSAWITGQVISVNGGYTLRE